MLTLCLILYTAVQSQEIERWQDFGIWTGLGWTKTNPKLEWNLRNEYRFFKNASRIDDIIVQVGVKRPLNDYFKLGFNYRHNFNFKRSGAFETNNRLDGNLHFKYKLNKRTQIRFRARYQQNFIDLLNTYTSHGYSTSTIRHKAHLRYKLTKKQKIYFSSELFYYAEPSQTRYLSANRIIIGTLIKQNNKTYDWSIGYDQELNNSTPLSFFLTRFKYTWNK